MSWQTSIRLSKLLVIHIRLLLLIALPAWGLGQTAVDAQSLPVNEHLKRTLKGGETHSYKVTLKAGYYFYVDVQQRGIDVVLQIIDPGGKTIVRRDRPNGANGSESLSFITITNGEHQLEVKALDEKAKSGTYEITAHVRRVPTGQDRKRISAENLFDETFRLTTAETQTPDSIKQICEKYEEAAKLWHDAGDKYAESLTETQLGFCRQGLQEHDKAIMAHTRALGLYRELQNKNGVALSLSKLCAVNVLLLKPELAIKQYREATSLYRELRDPDGEKHLTEQFETVGTLVSLKGFDLFNKAKAPRLALPFFTVTQQIYHELGSKKDEALALLTLGVINYTLAERQSALAYLNQAVPLYKGLGEQRYEATALSSIGLIYFDLGERQRALDYFGQALPLFRNSKDISGEASTLLRVAAVSGAEGERDKAGNYYSQALSLFRKLGDKKEEAAVLDKLGSTYSLLGEKQKALEYFNEALLLYQLLGDRAAESSVLNGLGLTYSVLGEKQKALDYYGRALTLSKAVDDKAGEVQARNNIGAAYYSLGEKQKALQYQTEALLLAKTIKDKPSEAICLNNVGKATYALGETGKALEYYKQALSLSKEIGSKETEALTVHNIARVYMDLGESQKALDYLDLALTLRKATGNRLEEANTLKSLGEIYYSFSEMQKALDFYEQALSIYKRTGAREGEGEALNNIGVVYSALSEHQRAFDYLNQSLLLDRKIGNKSNEASTLSNIGLVYAGLGERQKALEYYNQALPLRRATGDREGEASTLNNIGRVYDVIGEKQKALDYFDRALQIKRMLGNKAGEAAVLNNKGLVYRSLDENQKAFEYFIQALALFKKIENKIGEAVTYNNLATLGFPAIVDNHKALEYLNQALPLVRAVGDKAQEATTLGNIATIYSLLGEKQKALEYQRQALPLVTAVGDKWGKAIALNNIGTTHASLGEKQKALEYLYQALPLIEIVGDKYHEALIFSNLMVIWQDLGNPRLAIFYGKLSVNAYQEIRGNVQGLERDLQQNFLKSVESPYRNLTLLLLGQKRLSEAHRVLNLFKDQEFFDFAGRIDNTAKKEVGLITMTVPESAKDLLYQQAMARLGDVSRNYEDLKRRIGKGEHSAEELQQLNQLEADFKSAQDEVALIFQRIEKGFSQVANSNEVIESTADTTNLQAALKELSTLQGKPVIAVYAFAEDDHFYALVVTPSDLMVISSPIRKARLNSKAKQLWALLQSDQYDPKPLSKEIYDLVFKPIKDKFIEDHKLEQALPEGATIMWSLDGNLRYLPMAALYDGEKYLVERYHNIVFTRADTERWTRSVNANWTGAGFGNSRAGTIEYLQKFYSFEALPKVSEELNSVFKTNNSRSGVFEGEVFVDQQFTQRALIETLKEHRPLVHISSHFKFSPGDGARSFLLLGDGKVFPLSEIKQQTGLFQGVELLTLSACETAAQWSRSDGREVDGFAELAQRLGASAVLATLWKVRDDSSFQLMREFYQKKQGTKQSKAESLRQAQIALLKGTAEVTQPTNAINVSPKRDSGNSTAIKILAPGEEFPAKAEDGVVYIEAKYAKPFDPQGSPRYAHPYFWSPFILFSNWR